MTLFQYGLSIVRVNQYAGAKFTDCESSYAEYGLCFLTGDDYLGSVGLMDHGGAHGELVLSFAVLAGLLGAFTVAAFFIMRLVATAPAN